MKTATIAIATILSTGFATTAMKDLLNYSQVQDGDDGFDLPGFKPRPGQCIPSQEVKSELFDIFEEYTIQKDPELTELTHENYVALLQYYGVWGHEFFIDVWDKVMQKSTKGMDFLQFQHALAQATKQSFYEWNYRRDGEPLDTCRIYEDLTARRLMKQKLRSVTFSHVLELHEKGNGGDGSYKRVIEYKQGRSRSSTISHAVQTKLELSAKWMIPIVVGGVPIPLLNGDVKTTTQYDFSSVTEAVNSEEHTVTSTLELDFSVDNYAYAKKTTICYQDYSCESIVGGLVVSHDGPFQDRRIIYADDGETVESDQYRNKLGQWVDLQ